MASAQKTNYYDILGVSQNATSSEIRKAFQQKARKLHPDINKAPDAEERFKEVSEAYAVLSDEQKRRRYDASLNGNPFMSQSSYGSQDPFAQGGLPRLMVLIWMIFCAQLVLDQILALISLLKTLRLPARANRCMSLHIKMLKEKTLRFCCI